MSLRSNFSAAEQLASARHPSASIQNRTVRVRLADIIDEGELREQLDHVRSLRLTRGESTWLRGNTFYGKRQMFSPEFMDWL